MRAIEFMPIGDTAPCIPFIDPIICPLTLDPMPMVLMLPMVPIPMPIPMADMEAVIPVPMLPMADILCGEYEGMVPSWLLMGEYVLVIGMLVIVE